MAGVIPQGSKQKLINAALFAVSTKETSFLNMLTGASPAPKGTKAISRAQTDNGSPVVRVTDLSKGQGKEVTVDIIHPLTKQPTMGDQKIAGRGEDLSFANDTLFIDQYRHLVDDGGLMLQQDTTHKLSAAARASLMQYHKKVMDEVAFYHFNGARGTEFKRNSNILPLASNPNFKKVMVNNVLAPTYENKFYGGDATSVDTLDSADLFSLSVVDNVWLHLQETSNHIPYVRLMNDKQADEAPMYVMLVTARQWNDFYTTTSAKEWQQMQASAIKRSSGWGHPIFQGDCVMYRGILIKPMNRRVRWEAGDKIEVCANDRAATINLETTAVPTERALLLGAQGVATAYGKTKAKAGAQFSINTETTDHGNATETSVAWVQGIKKLQFEDSDGYKRDHGIITIDTAVAA